MSDVDDELLALVGNGSSSSRSVSPPSTAQKRTKRRRPSGRRKRDEDEEDEDEEDDEDDVGQSDLDAEGSDDEGMVLDEPVNPFRLEGIYKDEEDRERLLDMPELEREAELASRRDLITKRRQKADLRAMVRTQQMAGKKSSRSQKPAKKKSRKLKKATSIKRRKRDDSDEEQDDFDEEDDEEEEEEDEESDFESGRRTSRARKTEKPSGKAAQLQKLKQSRAKVQRRRQGKGDDDESSAQETSESEYDAEEAEAHWRQKKERERRERGESKRGASGEVKASREQERLANKRPWTCPTLKDINIARVRRDHIAKIIHKPNWMSQLMGKFARINYHDRDKATGRDIQTYRLVQITDCYSGDRYYDLENQYTNAICTMQAGDDKVTKIPLRFISNSAATENEYDEWRSRTDRIGHRMQRVVPSHEATLDQAEDLESFLNKPFTEDDINQMLKEKKAAREAFEEAEKESNKQRQHQQISVHTSNGHGKTQTGNNEWLMLQMNEKHRKADQKRIAEAERKIALQHKLAAQRLNSKTNTPSATPPRTGTPLNGISSNGTDQNNSPLVKATTQTNSTPLSIAIAAADLDVDLGDF